MASYMFTSAVLSILVSLLTCAVSCVVPFWVRVSSSGHCEGLLGQCNLDGTQCVTFFDNDFQWEKTRPGWMLPVQVTFFTGLLLLFSILLTASCHICFCCCPKSIRLSAVLASLTIIAFLLLATSIGVYGTLSYKTRHISLTGIEERFEWAFFSAIASAGSSLVAAVQFISNALQSSEQFCSHVQRDHVTNQKQTNNMYFSNDRLL